LRFELQGEEVVTETLASNFLRARNSRMYPRRTASNSANLRRRK
jgi:hypothetical protein